MLRNLKTVILFFLLQAFSWPSFAQLGTISKTQDVLKDARKILDSAQFLLKEAGNILSKIPTEGKMPLCVPFEDNLSTPPANAPYLIKLNSLKIDPRGAEGDLFMKIDKSLFSNSQSGPIYLAAKNVRFTKNGGFTGESKLFLLQNEIIPIAEHISLKIYAINPINSSVTYVSFDCGGFKKMHLSASLILDSTIASKEDANGKRMKGNVEALFETDINTLTGWMADIKNIPPFQFKALPDFTWTIKNFVYDNSTSISSSELKFPQGYSTTGTKEFWKGFYCREATVTFPKYLREREKKGERITISARDILIDNSGFSGGFTLKDAIKDGDMGSWKYNVKELSANFDSQGHLGFGMVGLVDMPLAKNNTQRNGFEFSGSYVDDKLKLEVLDRNRDIDFSLFRVAQFEIPTVGVELEVGENDLQAALILSGKITVSPFKSQKDTEVKLDTTAPSLLTVTFERLTARSRKPYLSVGRVELESEAMKSRLAHLPIKVENPYVDTLTDGIFGLGFKVSVNFMENKKGEEGSEANGIAGHTDVRIFANYDETSHKWKYKNTKIDEICINAGGKAYKFKGCVEFFDEPETEWGQGFTGNIQAKFGDKIEVQVGAMFGGGRKEDASRYRYWYVDAGIKFAKAIPIFTGVGINGFYGGAYYNMTQMGTCSGGRGCISSGIQFKPVTTGTRLGVRAGVGVSSLPTEAAFEGTLIFTVEMRLDNFSIEKIAFNGRVKFINTKGSTSNTTEVKEGADSTKPAKDVSACVNQTIEAKWYIEYNFREQILSGNFGLNLMYNPIIRGNAAGSSCSAGTTEIYFSPKKWYIYMGRPTSRMAFNVVDIFNAETYLVMGSELPVPAIAPLENGLLKDDIIDPTLLKYGAGFGFGLRAGAQTTIGADKLKMGPCNVTAGVTVGFKAGFDVLIAQDLPGSPCYGRGINNWYATGQAFLTAFAKIGADIDCMGKVDVAEFILNAAVRAQTPKPTYLQGAVSAEIKIFGLDLLGDLADALKFTFKFGQQPCGGQSISEQTFAVIEKIYPSDTSHKIGPYSGIQVTLNQPVGNNFIVRIPKDDNGYNSVPVTVGGPFISSIKSISKGTEIKPIEDYFDTRTDQSKTNITFVPKRVLTPGIYEATVRVPFSNNTEDVSTIRFTILKEEVAIPKLNVASAYPLPNMKNFYKLTGTQGYIRLRTLPNVPVSTARGFTHEARFFDGSKQVAAEKVTYNPTWNANNFTYNIPASQLENNKQYTLKIVKVAETKYQTSVNKDGIQSGPSNPTGNPIDSVIIEYNFTTSKFSTFQEKIGAFQTGKSKTEQYSVKIPLLSKSESGATFSTEDFSEAELSGYSPEPGEQLNPLVRLSGLGSDLSGCVSANPIPYSFPDPREPQSFPYLDGVKIVGGEGDYEIAYNIPYYLTQAINQSFWIKSAYTKCPNLIGSGSKSVVVQYFLPGTSTPEVTVTIPFETSGINYAR